MTNAVRPAGEPVRERWAAAADGDDVLRLDVPPHATRERAFEVFCSLAVDARGRAGAWHELRVWVDGERAWSRRVDTDAGGPDTLDVRLHRRVPVGEPLRVVATAAAQGAAIRTLQITADEE